MPLSQTAVIVFYIQLMAKIFDLIAFYIGKINYLLKLYIPIMFIDTAEKSADASGNGGNAGNDTSG